MFSADAIARDLMELLRLPLQQGDLAADFDRALGEIVGGVIAVAARVVLPPVVIGLAVATIANVIVNRGPLFSLEPIKPKIENIDPVSGFKRVYSARSAVELAKSLVKVLLLGSALTVLVLAGLDPLLRVPGCGMTCIPAVFAALVKPLIVVAALAFLAIGFVDVLVQNWLFERDMRMTKSEAKREQIEQHGNPAIRAAHQRQRREAAEASPMGIRQATLVIVGPGTAIGLRYVRGETPVPMVVCRGRDEAASAMVLEARSLGLAVTRNPRLAAALDGKSRPGKPVPGELFSDVARAILQNGAMR